VKVEILEGLDAVGPTAWQALHASTALRSPFMSWTWQSEWARAFASQARMEIRRVTDDAGHVSGLLPLHEVAPGVFQLVGGADVSDYLDLLAEAGREEEVWNALLVSRAGGAAVWDLHAVPATSPTVARVPALAAEHGVKVTVTMEERCPILALPESWDAYLAALTGKQRHELGRKIRRLEREVPEARAIGLATRAEVEARFDDFLVLHRRSRVGKARFMDERMEAFFRRVATALAEQGGLRLWLLDAPGGPLASFLCLEWDGSVGLYNSGFDPERAALSPGVVLIAHIIRDAIARGRRRFDFLRGEERYKYDFGPTPEDVFRVTLG
jgi:CelD/BcsL family acetyltransferase involved in cellulose biosynthesis